MPTTPSNSGARRTMPVGKPSWVSRLRLTGASLLSLALVGGAAWLVWDQSRAMVSPVTEVVVHGEFKHLTGTQVENCITPYLADGFWRLDVNSMGVALTDLPWVKSADVRRVWPSTVILEVKEQQAAAIWMSGGYLNPQGELFQPENVDPEFGLQLVSLQGPAGSEHKVVEQLAHLHEVLEGNQLVLRRLSTDARRSWRLLLDNGIELNMGKADLKARLQRFIVVYHQVLKRRVNEVASVDLRYSNGLAVSWKAADDAVINGG